MKKYQLKYSNISKLIDLNSPVFVSKLSLFVCILLSVFGILLGTSERSLAVQINGLIALVDVINALFFLSAVRHSVKMPDLFYNYGYGKYESLSVLVGATLLILITALALYETVMMLGEKTVESNYTLLLSFSAFSFILMYLMSRFQQRAAEKHKMPILEYDSKVWKNDSFLELGIVANLMAGAILFRQGFGNYADMLDSVTAVVLLAFALKVPIKYGRKALDELLDRTLPEEFQYDILACIVDNISKMCEYRGVHTRKAGRDIFIEVDVIMPYDITLEEAFQTEKAIQNSITEKYPTSILRLYVMPCSRDCVYHGKNNCPVKKSLNIVKPDNLKIL